MNACIEVHKLKKSYGSKVAVKEIDMLVQQQEICAFLGPNGAGKSTTINILTTLLAHDAGEVRIEGCILGKQDDLIRNKLGIVFQQSVLDEQLSAYENLILRSGLYHMSKTQAKQRIKEVSTLCQLESFLHQKIKQLSGGQRRRVDIARALIPNPALLILDEPSTGLDPTARRELWQMLQTFQANGMTIFFSTHDMAEAELADHIIMIKDGVIVLDGKKEALIAQVEKEQLLLYSQSTQQLCKILQQKHYHYQQEQNYTIVSYTTFFELMSILRSVERYVHRIELRKGSMEHVYLSIMEGTV